MSRLGGAWNDAHTQQTPRRDSQRRQGESGRAHVEKDGGKRDEREREGASFPTQGASFTGAVRKQHIPHAAMPSCLRAVPEHRPRARSPPALRCVSKLPLLLTDDVVVNLQVVRPMQAFKTEASGYNWVVRRPRSWWTRCMQATRDTLRRMRDPMRGTTVS